MSALYRVSYRNHWIGETFTDLDRAIEACITGREQRALGGLPMEDLLIYGDDGDYLHGLTRDEQQRVNDALDEAGVA